MVLDHLTASLGQSGPIWYCSIKQRGWIVYFSNLFTVWGTLGASSKVAAAYRHCQTSHLRKLSSQSLHDNLNSLRNLPHPSEPADMLSRRETSWRTRSPTAPPASESPEQVGRGGVSLVLTGTKSATGVIWHWGVSGWFAYLFKVWRDEHEMLGLSQLAEALPGHTSLHQSHPHRCAGKAFRTYLASTGLHSLAVQGLTFTFFRSLSRNVCFIKSQILGFFFFFFTIKRLLSPFNGCPKDPWWSISSVPWWGAGFGSWCTREAREHQDLFALLKLTLAVGQSWRAA